MILYKFLIYVLFAERSRCINQQSNHFLNAHQLICLGSDSDAKTNRNLKKQDVINIYDWDSPEQVTISAFKVKKRNNLDDFEFDTPRTTNRDPNYVICGQQNLSVTSTS